MGTKSAVIGKFEVESARIHVSDPCYEKDDHYTVSFPAWNGDWKAKVTYGGDGRVTSLVAEIEKDFKLPQGWLKVGEAGVDGGVMSIFDFDFYRKPSEAAGKKQPKWMTAKRIKERGEKFYGACCSLATCDESKDSKQGGVLPHGAAATSGYGDGVYSVYIQRYLGKAIAVKVRF